MAAELPGSFVKILSSLRNQITKSRRLVSEKSYKSLVSLYDQIVELDAKLANVIRNELPRKQRGAAFSALQKTLRWEMTEKLDETINMLAQEVGLKQLSSGLSPAS
jgi:hypothetical protein